jgi:uncharacterized protein YndB with AHSA1/START domain
VAQETSTVTKQSESIKRSIVKQIELNAPAKAVWRALTDPEELVRWFPLEAKVTPGVGGSLTVSWGDGMTGTQEIEIWEPNKRLRLLDASRFSAADSNQKEFLSIDWSLEKRGGKTLLRLIHFGFGEGPDWENEYFDSVNYGWDFMLANLRLALEVHPGIDRKVAWPRKILSISREEAYRRLAAPGMLFDDGLPPNLKTGDALTLETATGESWSGRVEMISPPRGFGLRISEWNDALVWLTIEGVSGRYEAQIWLSAYGIPDERVSEFEQNWKREFERIFE